MFVSLTNDWPQWMKFSSTILALKELTEAQRGVDTASPLSYCCHHDRQLLVFEWLPGFRHHSKDFTPYLILTTSWAKCNHYPHLQLRKLRQCLLTCPSSPEPMCLFLSASLLSSPSPHGHTQGTQCQVGHQHHRRAPSLSHHLVSDPITKWNIVKNQETWEQASLMWLVSVSQMSKTLFQSPFSLGCQGNVFGNTQHTF